MTGVLVFVLRILLPTPIHIVKQLVLRAFWSALVRLITLKTTKKGENALASIRLSCCPSVCLSICRFSSVLAIWPTTLIFWCSKTQLHSRLDQRMTLTGLPHPWNPWISSWSLKSLKSPWILVKILGNPWEVLEFWKWSLKSLNFVLNALHP